MAECLWPPRDPWRPLLPTEAGLPHSCPCHAQRVCVCEQPLVSRLGASAEPASPPAAPTQTLLRLFRPFVGQPHRPRSSLVTVGLARSSGEGEGEAGISDTVPRIQWEEVGHTWSLDSGTFSGTLLPESSSGWALFPVLSLRQGVHSLVVVLLSDLHPLLYFLIQFSFHKLLC